MGETVGTTLLPIAQLAAADTEESIMVLATGSTAVSTSHRIFPPSRNLTQVLSTGAPVIMQ